jgi:GNAT superfamily N-acetyltransferase
MDRPVRRAGRVAPEPFIQNRGMDEFPPLGERARGLTVAVAAPGELGVVLGILRSASAARAAQATFTWGSEFPDVVRDIPGGLVHLARVDGRPAGTFVLRWSDENVWGPDDGEAGYLHRLAAHPGFGGRGLGAGLIAAAGDLIRSRGRRWLRLDCDQANGRLRGYYESLGFSHAGDVTGLPRTTPPGYRAASRYQRAVPPVPPGSPGG